MALFLWPVGGLYAQNSQANLSPSADPSAVFDSAVGLWDSGEYGPARELFLRLESIDPQEAATQAYLMRSDVRLGLLPGARARLQRLRETVSGRPLFQAQLAEWCLESGDPLLAAEQAEYALRLNLAQDRQARLHYLAGSAWLQRGQARQAIEHLASAARLDPANETYAAAWLNALGAERIEDVPIAALDDAARRFPESAGIAVLRGLRYLAGGNFSAAKELAGQLAARPESRGQGELLLGRVALADLDFAGAVAAFESALESGAGEWRAHAGLGIALRKLDRLEEAEASLRRALQLYPAHVESRLELAQLLADQGRVEAALEQLNALLAVAPNQLQGLYLGFLLHRRNGSPELAAQWLARRRALQALATAP